MAAEAEAAAAAPLHSDLPEEIVIWEILVRLPPNSLLRCRAVCRSWRRATSTRDFLLAHHDRQPALPILYDNDYGSKYQDIVPFDHHRLQPIGRLDGDMFDVEASCDGLLLLSDTSQFAICNPATRQYAPLPQLDCFTLLGMYPHTPTGEYRLLLLLTLDEQEHGDEEICHVLTLGSGSCQPPRGIGTGWPEPADETFVPVPVLFSGGLHWHLDQRESGGNTIVVFDTTAESFRQMGSPVHGGHGLLLEMDGIIAMFNFINDVIDIWVLQDYESEAWAFKCRVGLPAQEIKVQSTHIFNCWRVVAMAFCDGDVMFLVSFGEWLHQVDIYGKLVSSFRGGFFPTQLQLKETLVPRTFFPKLKGYVVNVSPSVSTY